MARLDALLEDQIEFAPANLSHEKVQQILCRYLVQIPISHSKLTSKYSHNFTAALLQ